MHTTPAIDAHQDNNGNSKTDDHQYEVSADSSFATIFGDGASDNSSDGNVIFSSYRFLDGSRLSSLPTEDVEYLISKRCLHVPKKDALDEFVTKYFAMVHPFVPLIDEAEFWSIYNGTAGICTLSLFLFQAILFSSCAVSTK